jgi:hypothetical protein
MSPWTTGFVRGLNASDMSQGDTFDVRDDEL